MPKRTSVNNRVGTKPSIMGISRTRSSVISAELIRRRERVGTASLHA